MIRLLRNYWYVLGSIVLFCSIVGGEFYYHYVRTHFVSFELGATSNTSPRRTVSEWLFRRKSIIDTTARRWSVSPIAVAGVIAYEGIEDPLPAAFAPAVRFSGPGKVHYKQFYNRQGDPVAKQVEDSGYLPHLSEEARRQRLSSTVGAVTYICAIMRMYSDEAARVGFHIDDRPEVLATLYSAWRPSQFRSYLQTVRGKAHQFEPNVVGFWVLNNEAYLLQSLKRPQQ